MFSQGKTEKPAVVVEAGPGNGGARCILHAVCPPWTDGKQGETEVKAQEFAQKLGDMTGIEIALWDERFTTVSAHSILDTANVHGKKRKNVVDSVAAVLILEGYMNYRKNHS